MKKRVAHNSVMLVSSKCPEESHSDCSGNIYIIKHLKPGGGSAHL